MTREEVIVIERVVTWPEYHTPSKRSPSDELWIAGIIYFPIGIFFLTIGGAYWHSSCSSDASIYLVVHGSLLVINFFVLLLAPNSFLLIFIGIANLSVWLWATVQLTTYHNKMGHGVAKFYGNGCSQVDLIRKTAIGTSGYILFLFLVSILGVFFLLVVHLDHLPFAGSGGDHHVSGVRILPTLPHRPRCDRIQATPSHWHRGAPSPLRRPTSSLKSYFTQKSRHHIKQM